MTNCAVQAHGSQQSTSLVGGYNGFTDIPSEDGEMLAKGIAFYDSTGILLAALVNAGNAEAARKTAARDAAAHGDGQFSYSAEMVAPNPGSWTKFEYTAGSSDNIEYQHLDVRTVFHTWELEDLALENLPDEVSQLQLGVGVFQTKVTTVTGFGNNTEDAFALPISLKYSRPTPGLTNLRASVGGAIDVVMPIIAVSLESEHTFGYEAMARVDLLVLPWLACFVHEAGW